MQLQADKLEQGVVKLDSQARDAIGAGREDLARTALERKAASSSSCRISIARSSELEAQQQKLATNERTLSTRIESFRSEKEVIKAQYSAAEAQVKIGEAATGIGDQMADTGLGGPAGAREDRGDAGARRRRWTS